MVAHKTFLKDHWKQIHSTNPLERLNKEIKRRTQRYRYLSKRKRHKMFRHRSDAGTE